MEDRTKLSPEAKKEVNIMLFTLVAIVLFCLWGITQCSSCINESNSQYDDEYWRSVQRQRTMEDAGYNNAAKEERDQRLNRLQGK